VAPPPSLGFPYQDITHVLSLAFGALATVLAWRDWRAGGATIDIVLPVTAAALVIANLAVQGVLAL
jgi:hypothetical protein